MPSTADHMIALSRLHARAMASMKALAAQGHTAAQISQRLTDLCQTHWPNWRTDRWQGYCFSLFCIGAVTHGLQETLGEMADEYIEKHQAVEAPSAN